MITGLLILLAIMGLIETMFRWGLRKELKRLGYKCIFIFFTFNCFGQFGFGSYNRIPLLIGNSLSNGCTDIPCQIGGMYLRLKAADNIPGVGVSNWVDEIHGWNWFTNNPGTFITNSYKGVLFNNSGANFDSILRNTNSVNISPTNAMFMVIQPLATVVAEEPVIGGIGGNTVLYGPTYAGAQAGFTSYQQANGGYRPWAKSGGLALNQYINVISIGGPDPVQTYTNGIAALTFSGAGTILFNAIGDAGNNTLEQMSLYIAEIIVWSNTVLTSVNVSNLNYYATNTYGSLYPGPLGAIRLVGQSYTMFVNTPLAQTYQWRKAGVDIAGATTSTLTFGSEALSDSSTYDCRMTSGSYTFYSDIVSNVVVSTTTVSNWCVQVTTNGGVFPTLPTISAVDTFWNGLVTDGIDSKMQDMILMVPDNFIAATTPLVKTLGSSPWVNHSFVGGDLSVNGLHGNASTKFLDTGVSASSTTVNDDGMVVYLYSISSGANPIDMGCQIAPNTFFFAPEEAGTMNAGFYNITAGQGLLTAANVSPFYGYYSAQRTGASAAAVYYAMSSHSHASLTTSATTGGSLPAVNIWLFALNNNGSAFGTTDSTISFAAVTKSLNSTQDGNLFSRVQTLRTSLGGGFR